jgi:hypothetical protein
MRGRKVGIVALARKLAIALWRFVEDGVVLIEFDELAAPAVRRLATGKIDGCLQPSSSLVCHPRFRAFGIRE